MNGVFEGFARGLKVVGGIAKAMGQASDEPDVTAAGDALEQAASDMPGVREQVREQLPGVLSAAGDLAGRKIFDLLDGSAPAPSSAPQPPRRGPFGRT